jgi:CheY-like chemotaxis protein
MKRIRILPADDRAVVRRREALHLAESLKPDLVAMDVAMPEPASRPRAA